MLRLALTLLGYFLCPVLANAGIFLNTGSISQTCIWQGGLFLPPPPDQPSVSRSATGTNLSFTECPSAAHPDLGEYVGPPVSGSATGLNVSGDIVTAGDLGTASFQFQGLFDDALLPIGGSGSGMVQFTLKWDYCCGNDGDSSLAKASFSFNGVTVWSDQGAEFNFGPPQEKVVTIDEPFQYGTPFIYSGFVSASGAGPFISAASSSLSIDPVSLTGGSLIEVPEPTNAFISMAIIAVLLVLYRAHH